MIPEHRPAFWQAAAEFGCWIGVVDHNRSADRWIRDLNNIAKPNECKMKAAKSGRFAGLVVNPRMVSDAFKNPIDREEALNAWRKFAPSRNMCPDKQFLPRGYRIAKDEFRGCITLDGKKIHSDYDVMSIRRLDVDFEEWDSDDKRPGPKRDAHKAAEVKFEVIRGYINSLLPKEMVMPGAEMHYDKVVERRQEKSVIWFLPNGTIYVGPPSRMSTKRPI